MPNPVSKDQTVVAVNKVLEAMDPEGGIENLDTDELSNKDWSCNFFSPSVLEEVCKEVGKKAEDLDSKNYKTDAVLPDNFDDKAFVNISMMGEPSSLNHNFNILVADNTVYLIQTYVDQTVKIVQRFNIETFMQNWKNLSSNNNGWAAAYETLFGVKPGVESADTWMNVQYVTN
ncbi:hypothetical protein AB6D02_23980 [Vibrio splendidus]|uniref:hypothetical protein n=1 Tax=Vibrio TaxID=662 RepID=UPI000C82E203|nr:MULTISPECIES: hypothetical protein [Vibrio]MCC4858912.1 hypothetical protein [Vibrio lentus]PMO18371.1 hypothetical protein BCT15_22090 [Vibrio splendidus]